MAELSCGASLARIFLVVLNLLFSLIGLALLIVGGLLLAGSDMFDLLGEIVKQIPGLERLAIALVGLGCPIFVIGILGTCGACCSVKWMLVIYAVIVLLVTLAEGIVVALLYTGHMDSILRDGLSDLTSKYKVPSNTSHIDIYDTTSRLLDGLFIALQCCENTTTKFPPTCCKGVTRGALQAGDISELATCLSSPNSTNSNIERDCLDALMDLINENQSHAIGIGAGILVVEMLCVVFAFWICNQINNQHKVRPM